MEKRGPARTFQDLIVWRKAHDLVLAVYKLTRCFPNEETYGLTSQMRRAVTSVAANIAEGFKKKGKADKCRLMNVSQGSLEESRYYLILSQDLGYGDTSGIMLHLEEVSQLLTSYINSIQNSDS